MCLIISPVVAVCTGHERQPEVCGKSGLFKCALQLQSIVVVFLAPRQIDRGDMQWQLLENTEAGKCRSCSVGSKSGMFALIPISIIT